MNYSDVSVLTNSLPVPFCFRGFNEDWVELVSYLHVQIPVANSGVWKDPNPPPPEYRDWVWWREGDDPLTCNRFYEWKDGNWVSPHPISPDDSYYGDGTGFKSMLFSGDANGITMLDRPSGEDSSDPVSDKTGPFWMEDTDMQARFPLGPGTLPSGLIVPVDAVGDEETHVLLTAEMPAHNHNYDQLIVGSGGILSGAGTLTTASQPTTSKGGDDAHNNMPPYRGRYFIKRTARVYYIV